MTIIKQAVILAGGLGTRLKPLTDTIPKPMIPFHNKPFLEYLIEMLKDNGIEEVVLLLGYLPEKIIEYFGDGSNFGLKITYSMGEISYETGTRIQKAQHLLDDYFLLMYCDNYWPLHLQKLVKFYDEHPSLMTVTVYTNKDRYTKNNIFVDDTGYVVKYDKTRKDENLNGVDIGFFIVNKKVMELAPDFNFSFEKEILPQLIKKRNLSAYLTDHRYYSVGNFERLELTDRFLQPKKYIFLDRDGVINKKAPKADYVKNWDEFEFLPGAIEAMKLLSTNGYQIYIITNQAGISRKKMTESDLKDIHEELCKELEKHNITINGIYYCPHGWDEGCDCRKPKPGMFFQAARDHDLDLTKIIFIGDDERDQQAGDAAGCTTLLISPENTFLNIINFFLISERKKTNVGDFSYKTLLEKLLDKYSKSKEKRFLISIAGCSRCGKTTLAKKIQNDLLKQGIQSSIISLDNWLLGLDERKGNETVRERFQYTKISDTITQLQQGKKVYSPVYDPKTRTLIDKENANPLFIKEHEIGIIDGVVALDIKELRDITDFKIFVDISDDLRKQRLIDFYVQYKNYSLQDTKNIIEPRENDEVDIIKKTKYYADFIYHPSPTTSKEGNTIKS